MEKVEKGVKSPVVGWHYYWKDGFRMDSPNKSLRLKTNFLIMVDGGHIDADKELDEAFPSLDVSNIDFRKLQITLSGALHDRTDFKFSIDFANVRDIKDEYLNKRSRFTINYIHADVKNRETPPAVDSGRANIFQARFQIGF